MYTTNIGLVVLGPCARAVKLIHYPIFALQAPVLPTTARLGTSRGTPRDFVIVLDGARANTSHRRNAYASSTAASRAYPPKHSRNFHRRGWRACVRARSGCVRRPWSIRRGGYRRHGAHGQLARSATERALVWLRLNALR